MLEKTLKFMTAKNANAVKCFAIGADSVTAMNDGLGLVSVLLPGLKTRHRNEFFSPCFSNPWNKASTMVKQTVSFKLAADEKDTKCQI